ncbi:MAG: hypothetical protein HGB34_02240 [Candidatus Moranbacteria bacterium]|nr:hypothetical protein [Candidatus Moranbacteria bacterium]
MITVIKAKIAHQMELTENERRALETTIFNAIQSIPSAGGTNVKRVYHDTNIDVSLDKIYVGMTGIPLRMKPTEQTQLAETVGKSIKQQYPAMHVYCKIITAKPLDIEWKSD